MNIFRSVAVATLFVFPTFLSAQDCNLKTQKDPYTKEAKISTGLLQLKGATVSIEATKTDIDFMFTVNGQCFTDASNAQIFFEGTRYRANYKNSGTMNCDGLFHFTFKNSTTTTTPLQNLLNRKIASIHFKDNEDAKKETVIELTGEQQQLFMSLTNCVITEAKKLLQ